MTHILLIWEQWPKKSMVYFSIAMVTFSPLALGQSIAVNFSGTTNVLIPETNFRHGAPTAHEAFSDITVENTGELFDALAAEREDAKSDTQTDSNASAQKDNNNSIDGNSTSEEINKALELKKASDEKAAKKIKLEQQKADRLIAELYQYADKRQLNRDAFNLGLGSAFSQVRTAAILGLGRIGGDNAAQLLIKQIIDPDETVRSHVALALGISNSADIGVPVLVDWLKNEKSETVQQEIILALGNLGGEIAYQVLNRYLGRSTFSGISAQALGLLASWHDSNHYPFKELDFELILLNATMDSAKALQHAFLLTRIPSSQQTITEERLIEAIGGAKNVSAQALLIKSWGRLSEKNKYELIIPYLKSKAESVVIESIRAVADRVNNPAVFTELSRLLNHESPSVVTLVFESLLKADNKDSFKNFTEKALAGNDSYIKLLALRVLAVEDPVRALGLITNFKVDSPRYLLVQSTKILGSLKSTKAKQLLVKWTEHKDTFVARAANIELKKINNVDRRNGRNTPKFLNALRFSQKQVEVKTNRGTFYIQLSDNALYTANNFVELVQKRFYDGTLFSRVIPNFVAQGGEHSGDGSGSVGYQIREEINLMSHVPGTVGMATDGKDTGGAQFFINLAPNLHLDRRYTIFGKVTRGWPVIRQLRMGDWIISARLAN